MFKQKIVILAVLALFAVPAHAGWLNVTGANFNIGAGTATKVSRTGSNPMVVPSFPADSTKSCVVVTTIVPQDQSGGTLGCFFRAAPQTTGSGNIIFKWASAAYLGTGVVYDPATFPASATESGGATVAAASVADGVVQSTTTAAVAMYNMTGGADCSGTTCNGGTLQLRVCRDDTSGSDTYSGAVQLLDVRCTY